MIGERLGQYEILEKLGQGGMGEVWRARDTALDREVAIKLLPELFSSDPERLARFEREAKLLASLNHPAIAAVHGLHEQDGRRFLAMELVPGEDLGRRLAGGPVGVEQALFLGAQVAEALEAAHAQGVVHRDLKPANIMLTPDGKAKVLDFGLAKVSEASGSGSASMSPTLTRDATAAGVILGTAAYMSPEQARGRPVDRRTDVWSFGCVLFECLTGGGLFRGESVSDSLGAILHKDPDWSLLPAGTPPTVRLLLRRCLAKDPDKRLHDIADARIELEQAIEDPTSSSMGLADAAILAAGARPRGAARRWLPAAAGLLALAAGLAAGWMLHGAPPAVPLRKLDLGVELEYSGGDPPELALSPDGSQVAFVHQGSLWVQALDTLEPRMLEGTEGAFAPFWSPDGEEIGYFLGQRLWRVPRIGGRGVSIGELGDQVVGGRGACWGPDGRIVFSRGGSGLLAIPALGGEPKEILALGDGDGDFHEPHVLPGGAGILFVAHPSDKPPGVLALLHEGDRRVLLAADDQRIAWPTYDSSGHILFRRTGGEVTQGIWALPFSLDRLEVTGEPFLVAPDAGAASVSRDGTLAFVHRPPAAGRDQVVRVDRSGQMVEPPGGDRVGVADPRPSPDGGRLAIVFEDDEDHQFDLWVRDLQRETETRLTTTPAFEFNPVWSTSGEEILFSHFDPEAGPSLAAFVVPADGSEPPRLLHERTTVDSVTADGRHYVATRLPEDEPISTTANTDVWLMPLAGDDEPRVLVASPAHERNGRLSPDGRWLAYVSGRSGKFQVYLTRFPSAQGRWQVSVGGGEDPLWDPRGDRLYFLEENKLMEVTVGSGDEPALGRAELVFELPPMDRGPTYVPAQDGEGFFIVQSAATEQEEAGRSGIKIVQNWIREFRE